MTQYHEQQFSHSPCPVDQLEWFVNATLPEQEQAAIEAHLAWCPSCQAEVKAWSELHHAMREVGMYAPEPRADLLLQVQRRLAWTPRTKYQSWLSSTFQTGGAALSIATELVRAQARLIRRDLFWIPLLIIPLVSLLVYVPPWQHSPGLAAMLAALLTALGMAFLYGQEVDPARELTLVTPTAPHLLLGVRCCLVFGYDLLLNCALVLPFLSLQGIVTPSWFVINWLAPLCCLSALALLLSILVNAGTAVVACILLWSLRLLGNVQIFFYGGGQMFPQAPWLQRYESFWHQGLLLFIIAVLALLLSFLTLERKERFAR